MRVASSEESADWFKLFSRITQSAEDEGHYGVSAAGGKQWSCGWASIVWSSGSGHSPDGKNVFSYGASQFVCSIDPNLFVNVEHKWSFSGGGLVAETNVLEEDVSSLQGRLLNSLWS